MELNKATLDCMQTLRRRLREELGTDIHLNQSDVVSALLAACELSDSIQTRKLGAQLAELAGSPASDDPARARPLYRGQVPQQDSIGAPPQSDNRQVRIYRGQRIYV